MKLELQMNLPEVVWLIRHAETATPDRFHGAESDVDLSERGRLQAEALGEWFASQKPTALVSSMMRRAIRTAEPVARVCRLEHQQEFALHERRVGEFSGRLFESVEVAWKQNLEAWIQGNLDATTPGAESFTELRDRLLPAWKRVVAAHPGERLVIIAHGVVCKVLLLTLLPEYGVADWVKMGKVANVATTRLVPTATGWVAEELLVVPPPVVAASGGVLTGIGLPASTSKT
jgi:2,3-bisphosphoglycerate-dependent phosphoglycerate mutase